MMSAITEFEDLPYIPPRRALMGDALVTRTIDFGYSEDDDRRFVSCTAEVVAEAGRYMFLYAAELGWDQVELELPMRCRCDAGCDVTSFQRDLIENALDELRDLDLGREAPCVAGALGAQLAADRALLAVGLTDTTTPGSVAGVWQAEAYLRALAETSDATPLLDVLARKVDVVFSWPDLLQHHARAASRLDRSRFETVETMRRFMQKNTFLRDIGKQQLD